MKRNWWHKLFRIIWKTAAWFVGVSFISAFFFRWVPVPVTPLMVIRCVEQKMDKKPMRLKHDWEPIERISVNLQLAVICSEDQNFVSHSGFDLKAIEESVEASKKKNKRLRGASTISQQTAKNVFLWPGRSWVRKGFEVYFTGLIELLWSKERILEVYLNSIEMGDGIYGAEAAANQYFRIQASQLSRYQAASIAAILPNPRKYKATAPGPYVQGRIEWIMGQMQQYGPLKLD